MPNLENAHIARLKKGKYNFEILVDVEKALDFKKGKQVNISDVLASYEIYKDAKKGERASNLKEVFNTEDVEEIAKEILLKGEIQLTAEYLKKERERMLKEIIAEVHRQAIDPTTKLPIPTTRIENALKEVKFNVELRKSVQKQVEELVSKLKYVMPIKIEMKRISIIVPAQYTGKSYSAIKSLGNIEKEEWLNDGSLKVTLAILAGDYNDFVEKISKLTQGNVEIKDLTN